jgi:hypothetical protein
MPKQHQWFFFFFLFLTDHLHHFTTPNFSPQTFNFKPTNSSHIPLSILFIPLFPLIHATTNFPRYSSQPSIRSLHSMFVFVLTVFGLTAESDIQHGSSLMRFLTGNGKSVPLATADEEQCTTSVTEELKNQGITGDAAQPIVYAKCCARVPTVEMCSRLNLLCDLWRHNALSNSNISKEASVSCPYYCTELKGQGSACASSNATIIPVATPNATDKPDYLSTGGTVGLCFALPIVFSAVAVAVVYFVLLPRALKTPVDP